LDGSLTQASAAGKPAEYFRFARYPFKIHHSCGLASSSNFSGRSSAPNARVWAGIHFLTADVQSAVLGKKVVHWLDKQLLPTG